jgi:hypothetical protein
MIGQKRDGQRCILRATIFFGGYGHLPTNKEMIKINVGVESKLIEIIELCGVNNSCSKVMKL